MAQVNIDWGMPPANPFALSKPADIAGSFSQGFQTARDNAFQDEQRTWVRDQRQYEMEQRKAQQEAGQMYASGNTDGAQKRLAQSGNIKAAYELDSQNFERAQRAHAALMQFSNLLGDAQTPEEFEAAKRIAGQFGAKFDQYADADWQRNRDRVRLVTNYESQKLKSQLDREEQKAKIAKTTAEAASLDQNWEASRENPGYIFNKRTGEFRAIGAAPGASPYGGLVARKWAETEGPKAITEAAKAQATAADSLQTVQDMKALAPHIYSGSWAGIQAEAANVANKYLGFNFEGVAPTQLFNSLAQKFVGAEGQKYKPLSNSDVAFIEKGLPTLGKDPEGIKHILGAMETVAARDQLAKALEIEWIQKYGTPPDQRQIQAYVDQRIPSYVERAFGGQQSAPNAPRVAQQGQGQAQPAQSGRRVAVEGQVIQDKKTGARYVLKGGRWEPLEAQREAPQLGTMDGFPQP